MCFGYGRLGHRKEQCPYIIRQELSASEVGVKEVGETVLSSCITYVIDKLRSGERTSGVVVGLEQNSEQVDVYDGVYGPWLMVACRKNETKPLKSGGTSPR
nr:hypothetical protein CFP56_02328 [Quercus suber]